MDASQPDVNATDLKQCHIYLAVQFNHSNAGVGPFLITTTILLRAFY